MPTYYETREIAISERFVVQIVADDEGRIIATRVFDAYCDDIMDDCETVRAVVRQVMRREA